MKNEETLKANPPSGKPIISSRLPKAFSQPKHLNLKNKTDSQDAKAANEFKKVKKLLSPLKKSSPKNSAFRRVIHKLSCFPQITEKISSQITIELLSQSTLKLDEMMTLSILKSSCSTGTVRKSLHAPTFMLYASKEIPVNTLSTRTKLLETLKSWQKIQHSAKYLVEVNSTFWNSPEGCVTVIMEYMPGQSLEKLCETVGALSERVLKRIAKRVLSALHYYHLKVGPHGAVDMSHLLLDRTGKCKLAVGLSAKLSGKEENIFNDIYSFGRCLLSASLGNSEWLTDLESNQCCLFHSAQAAQGIPYLNRLSNSFKDFLCCATQYERKTTASNLISHKWITSEETTGSDVNIRELLEMISHGGKEYQINVNTQLQVIIESLKVILTESEASRPKSSEVLKDLAIEIGINPQLLYEKVLEIF